MFPSIIRWPPNVPLIILRDGRKKIRAAMNEETDGRIGGKVKNGRSVYFHIATAG